MRIEYIADDGMVFLTEQECIVYERDELSMRKLHEYVEKHIETSYCDDAGFSIIMPENVVWFIINHYDVINDMVKRCRS